MHSHGMWNLFEIMKSRCIITSFPTSMLIPSAVDFSLFLLLYSTAIVPLISLIKGKKGCCCVFSFFWSDSITFLFSGCCCVFLCVLCHAIFIFFPSFLPLFCTVFSCLITFDAGNNVMSCTFPFSPMNMAHCCCMIPMVAIVGDAIFLAMKIPV